MNKEIQSIIRNFKNTLSGQPWFGRGLYPIMEEVDVSKVYTNPNGTEHSLIELLYHMINWAGFILGKLDNNADADLTQSEDLDWREINTAVHTWASGLEKFRKIQENS